MKKTSRLSEHRQIWGIEHDSVGASTYSDTCTSVATLDLHTSNWKSYQYPNAPAWRALTTYVAVPLWICLYAKETQIMSDLRAVCNLSPMYEKYCELLRNAYGLTRCPN
jgi:hypothetical protein